MRIKEGLEEKYKNYLMKNIESLFTDKTFSGSYVLAVLLATESIGERLDDGMTPAEAFKGTMDEVKGLTGFMVGAVAETVAHYCPRGEEYRIWWNKKWGVDEKEKGTVNPAIVTTTVKKSKTVN